mmetsp:Transcript_5219/g.16418  ORF Transcript_5219/g.16418 Transcript_5219/m.16418 type:complete len:602 (-) Transcript_5219:1020-2825(-)
MQRLPLLMMLVAAAVDSRLLSEEVEEEHLDDFEECEEACEICEERHCKNLWLETPKGRHLTIAELTYTQNVCIVLLIALLTVFTALSKSARALAEKYELHHVEELPYDRREAPEHWVPTNKCSLARQKREGEEEDNGGAPAAADKDIEAPTVSKKTKKSSTTGDEESRKNASSTEAHAVLHRAFAFYATVKGEMNEYPSKAHETLVKVINQVPSEHYYQALLNSLNAELMGLGWIAIFIWIAEQAGFFKAASVGKSGRWGPQRPEEAKITFENVHFAVFIGVCVHFLFLFLALRFSTERFDRFLRRELFLAQKKKPLAKKPSAIVQHETRLEKDEKRDFFPHLRESFITWISANVETHFEEWNIANDTLTKELFDGVGDDFPAAVYFRLSLDNLVEHLVDVQHVSWFAILAIYGVEGLLSRVAEVDVPAVSLGVATLLNVAMAFTIFASRRELSKFCADALSVGHGGRAEHWFVKQLPRFLQTSTLYIVIQFSRFCVDTIVDPKTQMQRYRGRTSFAAWVVLQILNLLIHFVLNQRVFAQVSILLSTPPVIGAKSVDLVAHVCLLYNNVLSQIQKDKQAADDDDDVPPVAAAPRQVELGSS